MCNFLSALALKDGSIRAHWALDSHTDLVRYFKLPDNTPYIHHFAKVELTPVDWLDVATWRFVLDEKSAPSWWEDVAGRVEAAMRARARATIHTTGEVNLIVDGCWIVGGTCKVSDVRGGRIVRVQDNASIRDVWGHASISDVGGRASIRNVGGHASICNVGGHASISDVGGRASIRNVGGHASICNVEGRVFLDTSSQEHLK